MVLCWRMSELRIRIKYGEHEFEAEGAAEPVERRAEAFQLMVAPPPVQTPVSEPAPVIADVRVASIDAATSQPTDTPPHAEEPAPLPLRLEEITHRRGPIVSLSVKANVQDAVLVMLLGQRNFRQNESVSGIEIMEGLRGSGIDILRVDTLMTKLAHRGNVIAMGKHRRRRYRLSTIGAMHAEQIARALAAHVSPPTAKSAQAASNTSTSIFTDS
jgi:hypothetical protein